MNREYRYLNGNSGVFRMTLIFFTKTRTVGMVIVRDHQVSHNYKPGQP
ncbi:MAG: hypothetical protein GZ094_14780 [Mariniphaga sp.]|nr:hypothetical protein [Mariniphaga sp.]